MITAPKTLKKARKEIYGRWAGFPEGHKYEEGKCAYAVWESGRGMLHHQCFRNNGYGPAKLYCKQHAKMVENE